MNKLLSIQETEKLRELIDQAKQIIICAHVRPDGDAMGSSLGFANYLKQKGKKVNIVMPNPCPDFLKWIPGEQEVIYFDNAKTRVKELAQHCDLIFCLDFNSFSRIEELGNVLANCSASKVLIDHHLEPKMETVLSISHPQMSSTSELIFRTIWELNDFDLITKEAATAIYCGMMTDTGGFTYNSSRSEIYFIISQLLTKGIDKDKIYRNVFNNYSEGRIRMMGFILYEKLHVYSELNATVFTLSRQEQSQFSFKRGDTEGFVNIPLQIKGIKLSISLREDTDKDAIRVSLRSVDDFPCNKMAEEFFNGGGHLNASGGELRCSMEEALEVAQRAIRKYKDLLI